MLILSYEADLNNEKFYLKNQISIVTDTLFLYEKSSIVVPKFDTELNENVDW